MIQTEDYNLREQIWQNLYFPFEFVIIKIINFGVVVDFLGVVTSTALTVFIIQQTKN